MKKICTGMLALLLAASGMAQTGGRIRITLVGAQCNRETTDDMLERDGKGDEVFFNFNFVLANATGNSKLAYQKRTKVYGDAHGAYSNRVNVGSAVDAFGNNKGGIRAGDIFNCMELMGEYDMDATDVLTITPTIWEWDGGSDIMGNFINALSNLSNPISNKAVQLANTINTAGSNYAVNAIKTAEQFLMPNFANIFTNIVGKPGDRPIGMTTQGAFGPQQVVLRPSYIPTLINSNMGYGAGVLSVNYDEEALGNSRDHGNYTIFIKVEFVPKANPVPAPAPSCNSSTTYVPPPPSSGSTTTTAPPPPASNGTVTNSPAVVNSNVKVINRSLPANAGIALNNKIAGTWAGTYGAGTQTGPNFYSFSMVNNGTMQVLDNSGKVMATGTYTFLNNQFKGTYTYSSNNNTFSVAATFDGNNTLKGTWGSGTNASGNGNWIMTKK